MPMWQHAKWLIIHIFLFFFPPSPVVHSSLVIIEMTFSLLVLFHISFYVCPFISIDGKSYQVIHCFWYWTIPPCEEYRALKEKHPARWMRPIVWWIHGFTVAPFTAGNRHRTTQKKNNKLWRNLASIRCYIAQKKKRSEEKERKKNPQREKKSQESENSFSYGTISMQCNNTYISDNKQKK